MLTTRLYDAELSPNQNGRKPLTRRNTQTSDSHWIIFPNVVGAQSTCDENQPFEQGKKIRFNVSGAIFETFAMTLQRFPDTLLGSEDLRLSYYEEGRDEYFFNRNRESFESILFFYQSSGRLIKPVNVGVKTFIEELKFFQMGDDVINCFIQKIRFSEDQGLLDVTRNNISSRIWNFLEHPKSNPALFATFLSMSVICLSVVIFCLETLDQFKNNSRKDVLDKIEMFCVAWFTFELVLRFITSPSKLQFMKSALNIIDFLAVLPFYITVFRDLARKGQKSSTFGFFRVIRLVRVVRIFKLSRHMRVFKILGMTFMSSVNELLLLLFFVCIAVILFASAVFYADRSFQSIPDAFWWSIITLTNVGYGDSVPKSLAGKLIGSCCAICGIVVLALPIPIIVSSFMYFYNMDKENQKLEKTQARHHRFSMMKGLLDSHNYRRNFGNTRVSPVENASPTNVSIEGEPENK